MKRRKFTKMAATGLLGIGFSPLVHAGINSISVHNKKRNLAGDFEKEIIEQDIKTRLEDAVLPNGEKFELWEDQTNYKRILHVAQNHLNASDNNDGSVDKPFFTIQKAAEIAGPRDVVLIHEGTYRETVRPFNSGRSEKEMIFFKGAEGEKVIVTGAEIFKGPYTKSKGWPVYRSHGGRGRTPDGELGVSDISPEDWKPYRYTDRDNVFIQKNANVYMFKFSRGTFVDTNPFAMVNGPLIPWVGEGPSFIFNWAREVAQKKIALMKRGMLFCDGERLNQVGGYLELASNAGSFFIEDDGLTVHIRMPDDGPPDSHLIEFTAREQCFCPENRYCSYIRIENITFNKAGNGFPPPQRGALSTNCGNHFIINRCIVEDANAAGIDIGFQLPLHYSMADRGYQVVTNCEIRRCGISGICGTTGQSDIDYYDKQQPSILVAFNRLDDNCWQDFNQLAESSSIKLHHIKNTLLVGNFISGTRHGHAGIWIDAANENFAIRENVIINSHRSGIYVEATTHVHEVSNNIIVNTGSHGIRGSETDHIHCFRNVILGCKQGGIFLRYGGNRIFLGQTFTGEGVKIYENIIGDCEYALFHPTDKGFSDHNIYGNFSTEKFLRIGKPALNMNMTGWQEGMGWDINGVKADSIDYNLLQNQDAGLVLSVRKEGKSFDFQFNFNSPLQPQIETFLNDILKKG